MSYDKQLLDIKDVISITGFSERWVYKAVKDGAFPAPLKIGHSNRWRKPQIEEWLGHPISPPMPASSPSAVADTAHDYMQP